MSSSINYAKLDENLKLKHSQTVQNGTSSDLYAALMMTDKSGDMVKDLLVTNSKEQLSEGDKEKLWYTLDYLRIKGITENVFKNLTSDDFRRIKNHKTASYRVEELIKIIIEKVEKDDKKRTELSKDIDNHVNAMIKSSNAEVGNRIAEEISLTKITTKRARYYGSKIKDVIKNHTDKNGDIDRSKCYMDVIKYANYSSLGNRRRTTHRYITPIKFSRRNINKKTESTLRALKEKSETSKDPKEMLAINYIVKRLQEAYNYYKENTQVSNTTFDNTQDSIKDHIYRTAA